MYRPGAENLVWLTVKFLKAKFTITGKVYRHNHLTNYTQERYLTAWQRLNKAGVLINTPDSNGKPGEGLCRARAVLVMDSRAQCRKKYQRRRTSLYFTC